MTDTPVNWGIITSGQVSVNRSAPRLIFGEGHLRYVISEYMKHYHEERAHQGLDNKIIEPPPDGKGKIVCHERLGGLLKFYRKAA
jgi:hypothetical protein